VKAPRRRPGRGAQGTGATAHQAMLELLAGYSLSQLAFVTAQLGVADALAKGPLVIDALAARVGAHAPSLRRVLRALASRGVFAETAGGKWKLTPLAATLRSGVPASLHDFARMIVEDYNWRAWGELLHGVRTGEVPFDHVHGQPAFPWLREHPEHERVFAGAMASMSGTENPAVARAYDFGALGTLVDVGGAYGHLLATILRRHRRLRGILFDQPQVVEAAARSDFLTGVGDRCEVRGGSFFDGVPPGRRRLPDEVHHPRLGRRARARHPAPLPAGHGARGARAARRARAAAQRHAGLRQAARHQHAGARRGPGTDTRGVP
jgi:O-methyltransferase domain/Dimerisation domain